MIIQVGGSISFSPHSEGAKAKWLDYDTRHMLTELDPKPEFITVTTGSSLWDITQSFMPGDAKGTHLDDPKVQAAWSGMLRRFDSGLLHRTSEAAARRPHPALFRPGHVHQLEIIERLIRSGVYMGPMNVALRL